MPDDSSCLDDDFQASLTRRRGRSRPALTRIPEPGISRYRGCLGAHAEPPVLYRSVGPARWPVHRGVAAYLLAFAMFAMFASAALGMAGG